MDEATVRVLSDLVRMYDNQAKVAAPEQADYFRGGSAALRMAMQFLAGPVAAAKPATRNGNGSGAPSEPVETPYACPDCERSFAAPQALGMHRRRSHDVPGAARKH